MELDKFDHKFCGFMSKHDFTENPLARLKVTSNRLSKLTVDFSCYEFAEQPNGSPFFGVRFRDAGDSSYKSWEHPDALYGRDYAKGGNGTADNNWNKPKSRYRRKPSGW